MTRSPSLSEKAATRASRSRSDPAPDGRPNQAAVGRPEPSRPTAALGRYTRDPFDGLLDGANGAPIAPGSLLDTPDARRLFEIFRAGLPNSLYTFQLPLERAARPETSAFGTELLTFSSYSYLGLIGHPRVVGAVQDAVARYGTSTGGVRLLTGTLDLHTALEAELAAFLGLEACVVFSSGYDANIAAITSLFGPDDWAIVDQFAHRSIQDGCRMAGCETRTFRHNDPENLERRLRQARNRGKSRILVAVDGVFSMDGDQAPLADIVALKERYGAFLLVDEAHALGAIGATGRGTSEAQGVDINRIDIVTGSLSKAIPSSGGFVGGSKALKVYIQHSGAPYIFSAALTPGNAAAALESLRIMRDDPSIMARLRTNTQALRDGVQARGLDSGATTSPVVPLLLGDEWRAYRWARHLLENGVFVSAVVYPAVATGMARLRLCATASHEERHFEQLFEAIDACVEAVG